MHAVFWLLVLVSASVKMALSQGLEINSTADFVSFVNTVKKTIITLTTERQTFVVQI